MDYVDIAAARDLPGLRLVLTAGVPGPWSESAKYLLQVKGIEYTPVRQAPGRTDDALREWTGQTSAPVVIADGERPRSSWVEILYLAERLAPKPALIPEDMEDRVRMFGLAHELCGDLGLGWQRRLMLLAPAMKANAGGIPELLAGKYGYSPEAAAAAPARVAEILRTLSSQLRSQHEHGRRYLIGETLTALDLYWTAFAALIDPLPHELCPMPEPLRAGYLLRDADVRAELDPALLEHRDRIYRDHLTLPLDF